MEGFITDIETEGKLQYLEDSGYLGSYASMGGGPSSTWRVLWYFVLFSPLLIPVQEEACGTIQFLCYMHCFP